MDTQQQGGPEHLQELFRTSGQSINSDQEDVKMEDASGQQHQKEDIEMETLKEAAPPASTSTVTSDLAATSITKVLGTGAVPAPTKIAAAASSATINSHSSPITNGNGTRAVTSVAPMGTQLENALKLATETDDYRTVKRLVYQVFSDPDALSVAFVKGNVKDEAKAQWWGIDRDQMGRVFSLLDRAMAGSDQEAMQNTFRNALETLVTQPWNVCSTWQAPHALRFFLVLFEHPSMFDPDYLNVVGGLCRLFYYLSEDSKALVREQWMAFFSADELHRLMDILQQAITVCLYGSRKMDLVYAACGVLAELHVVNRERMNGLEPFATYDEFYNDAVNSEVDVVQDYSRSIIFWKKRRAATRAARRLAREEIRRRRQLNEEQNEAERERQEREREQEEAQQDAEPMPERQLSEMSFCDFPFVLDAASKSKVLQIDSDLEQRARAQDAVLSRSMLMIESAPSPYLVLKVRRENIVEDAMQQLVHLSTSAETLKKPLKVKFVGEEGIDEGGFELIGTLLGLAIYNAVILDVSFPHIVYKKLMGCTLGLEDLELALPDLGRGLRQLLNFEGDVEGVYQRNFEYSYKVFGEVKTVELKPGGSSIPVTKDNREEYVGLYVNYVLNKSVSRQYAAFHHGFHQVCNDEVLSMFRWEELQLLICGSSDLDFEALEEATHYEDGFTEDSAIIRCVAAVLFNVFLRRPTPIISYFGRDFWIIVHALPLEDKKKLLRFATGSDRVPIRGLSNLVFVISRNGPDSDRLPTAHTCQPAAAAALSPCTAYVAMLPYTYTTNDVAQLFAPFGKLARVLVLRDKQTRRSRGVAFVQFARAEDCAKAVAKMDKMPLEGMTLAVSLVGTTAARGSSPRSANTRHPNAASSAATWSSRKNLKKKKKKFDPHERAHYFNDEGVTNMLYVELVLVAVGYIQKGVYLMNYWMQSAAYGLRRRRPLHLAAGVPVDSVFSLVGAASIRSVSSHISAPSTPTKTDSYFSDEDASDDE
ncbi:Nucleotide-binding alpha-beta plait domain [Phytophthora cactorum]|nr:Nucleotide-binding alpha-beta plait domain [Phytophthora cactorum]